MRKIFINLTNHSLNEAQLKEIKRLGYDTVLEKEAVLPEELIPQLKQSPDDVEELNELANLVADTLKHFIDGYPESYVSIHLPIGSPLFQSLLFTYLINILSNTDRVSLLYSHSKRITEENPKTGEKRSIFKFEKFLEIKPKEVIKNA